MYTFEFYNDALHIPGDDDRFLIKPVINTGANQSWTVKAQIRNTHPNFAKLSQLKFGFKVKKNGEMFLKGRILEFKRDFNNTYSLYVEDKLAALNDSQCRPKEFAGSPEELFDWFLDNHNSQVSDEQKLLKGNVTVADPNDYISRSWEKADNTWNLMNSRLLDTLGGYLVIRYEEDGDYLDWLEGFSDFSTQSIEFGKNLTDFEQLIDAEETYTACIPYGAEIINYEYGEIDTESTTWEADKYYTLSGETYILIKSESAFNTAVSSGTAIYEITSSEGSGQLLTIESVNDGKDYLINENRAGIFGTIYAPADLTTWEDVGRPENLLEKASDWLNNEGIMLKETIELSAVDLAMTGADINAFEMYKNVAIKSEPHEIDISRLITHLTIAADLSEVTKVVLGSSRLTLSSQNVEAKKQNAAVLAKIKTTYNKALTVTEETIAEASSQILRTAEEITLGILAGYTTTSDLETYKKEMENLLDVNKEGFSFEFSQLSERLTEVGNEVSSQKEYIRLVTGCPNCKNPIDPLKDITCPHCGDEITDVIAMIVIGKSDNPITTVYTNDALEFRYNGRMVARFTNEVLEVRNISVENQIAFFDRWAIRKGAYIDGVGYNLNDMWIGG